MLKLKLASSDVCPTVAGERPSRMEGPDKMSPTLSLEESIREFRNNHVRLKLRRSSLSPASFADEGGQFPVCILEKTILYRVGHLLADLGWVDLDLKCSTIMLGQ